MDGANVLAVVIPHAVGPPDAGRQGQAQDQGAQDRDPGQDGIDPESHSGGDHNDHSRHGAGQQLAKRIARALGTRGDHGDDVTAPAVENEAPPRRENRIEGASAQPMGDRLLEHLGVDRARALGPPRSR